MMLGQLAIDFKGKCDKPGFLTYSLFKNKCQMAQRLKHKEQIWKMFLIRKHEENVYIPEKEKVRHKTQNIKGKIIRHEKVPNFLHKKHFRKVKR